MNRLQFRTLYREFLFRIVDLELLAPQGDITKLSTARQWFLPI